MGKELFDNVPSKVEDLLREVELGKIGLPDLQRPFVWPDSKVRDLLDSMLKVDGTKVGTPDVEHYMTLESGVLPESVFLDIADAIRAQNGLTVTYAPGDMAQAILDLVWDVGVKVRAMLLTDGTLEFNYRDGGAPTWARSPSAGRWTPLGTRPTPRGRSMRRGRR